MRDHDIAVVGMAAAFPGALDLDQYWSNLVNGVDAVREIPAGRLNGVPGRRYPAGHEAHLPYTRGGFLPEALRFDPLRYGIQPNTARHGDPDQFLALHIVDAALRDAGVAADAAARARADVILGRGGYMTNKMSEVYLRSDALAHLGDFLAERFPDLSAAERAALEADLHRSLPAPDTDSLSTCMPNLVASRVANRLDLHGAAYTIDAACASSLLAVEQAVLRLRSGTCDLAVAGGLHLSHTPGFWYVFHQLGALSRTNAVRPFDRRADGLLPGEGAGAVVLKRVDDALRDGDRVYALLAGVGSASDGRETAVLNPASAGQVRALERAYADAGVDPDTIGLLEAHGTATVVGDATEVETLKTFFGTSDRFPPTRAMGSVKSMIGHTMPAAGIAALVKTVLAVTHKILPPSLHCEEPAPALAGAPFYVNPKTRPWIHDDQGAPRRAGVNAFGFGGINAHVIVEEVPERTTTTVAVPAARPFRDALARPDELFLFAAADADALRARVERAARFVAEDAGELALHDLAAALAAEARADAGPCRLAAICPDRDRLAETLDAVAARLADAGAEAAFDDLPHVLFAPRAEGLPGRLAFLFPGAGFPGLIGNYPDHLLTLCLHDPDARRAFDTIEARDRNPEDPVPTSLIFQPPATFPSDVREALRARIAPLRVADEENPQPPLPAARNIATSGITFTNWVSFDLLKRLGVRAEMMCGQSQGEMAAMAAGGILDIQEIIPRFWESLALSAAYTGRGRLAFVGSTVDELTPYLDDFPSTSLAVYVSPKAQILGGENEEIARFVETMRAAGFMAQLLPYPPIHTPRLRYMRDEILRVVDTDVTIRRAETPVYSAITTHVFPDDEAEIRELALSNLDSPVRFWQTIHRMYEDGARVFVQAGGGTLASHIQSILEEDDAIGLAVDVDYRHPISQLHHLCAKLFTLGTMPDTAPLYRHRAPRPLDLDAPRPAPTPSPTALPFHLDWVPFRDGRRLPAAETAPAPTPEAVPEAATEPEAASAPAPEAASRVEGTPEETPRMPFIGTVTSFEPGREIANAYRVDLDEALFLRDHVFIGAEAVKPVESCLPVVPMTMLMEMMAETAAYLAPGLGLIGFEQVKAFRWVALQDETRLDLQVTARREPEDGGDEDLTLVRARVLFGGEVAASATLRFGAAYEQRLTLAFREGRSPRAWPFGVGDIYRQRYLFHGPAFQCVTALDHLDEQGSSGFLEVLPQDRLFASTTRPQLLTDPIILDGAMQIVGLCLLGSHDRHVLPTLIERLELYRPTPPPGTKVYVRQGLREVDVDRRTVLADVEVVDADGYVWMRVQGYHAWLLDYTEHVGRSQREPTRYTSSRPLALPGRPPRTLACLITQADLRHVNLDWAARLILHPEEVAVFAGLSGPKQWPWMLGRIAAKDAVRRWWQAEGVDGDAMPHPAAVVVLNDAQGRPYVARVEGYPARPMPHLSLAHTSGQAVALAAAAPAGVDLEPPERDAAAILSAFTTPSERDLLAPLLAQEPATAWAVRLWCAKEAVAKALGTGLDGRPTRFEAQTIDADGTIRVKDRETDTAYVVPTLSDAERVVAYALIEAADAPASSTRASLAAPPQRPS